MTDQIEGRKVVVTGATSGIGFETARVLAGMGADLLIGARTDEKAKASLESLLREVPDAAVDAIVGDLSSVQEVDAMADQVEDAWDSVDVLVNNAGLFKKERETTADGLETTFAVNHLAMFRFTDRLLPRILKGDAPRIVNVASEAHRRGKVDLDDLQSEHRYSGWSQYCSSKLMNVLHTYALSRRLGEGPVTVNCLHPGVVASGFAREFSAPMRKTFNAMAVSNEKGAETSIYLATSSEVEGTSGRYFAKCKEKRSSRASHDETLQEGLWARTEAILEDILE